MKPTLKVYTSRHIAPCKCPRSSGTSFTWKILSSSVPGHETRRSRRAVAFLLGTSALPALEISCVSSGRGVCTSLPLVEALLELCRDQSQSSAAWRASLIYVLAIIALGEHLDTCFVDWKSVGKRFRILWLLFLVPLVWKQKWKSRLQ